ncbi:MAG: hypothetical protein ACI4R8_02410 [Candidatus Caccovivens sp.]
MSKIKDAWLKIKNIKHIQIYLAIFIGIIVCAICFSGLQISKNDKSSDLSTENSSTTQEYVQDLENRLCNVLSKISGVGHVNVVITLQSGFSYEYATDTETKTMLSDGIQTTTTTENIILVSGQPVVVKELYPVVKGVVVVAEGAEDVKVKMAILEAVETVLQVSQNEITILA